MFMEFQDLADAVLNAYCSFLEVMKAKDKMVSQDMMYVEKECSSKPKSYRNFGLLSQQSHCTNQIMLGTETLRNRS